MCNHVGSHTWMSHKCMSRITHLLWDMTPSHVSHKWMLRSHSLKVSTSECLTSACCASFTCCETWLLHMCLTCECCGLTQWVQVNVSQVNVAHPSLVRHDSFTCVWLSSHGHAANTHTHSGTWSIDRLIMRKFVSGPPRYHLAAVEGVCEQFVFFAESNRVQDFKTGFRGPLPRTARELPW